MRVTLYRWQRVANRLAGGVLERGARLLLLCAAFILGYLATACTSSQPTTYTPAVASPRPIPSQTAPATPAPQPLAAIQLRRVAQGLQRPVYLTHAGDERLFVVEQAGVIHILEQGRWLEPPFLDIRDRVGSRSNEQGLLGLAFHPAYAANGSFFVYYTNLEGDVVIAHYQVSDQPDQAQTASERVLLTIPQPFPNHNGGQLAFGPDGYLYAGVGDGGAANDPQGNGQNPHTWLGKLLRLDVDNGTPYAAPPSNPFVGTSAGRLEIWALGLRNPWRFSFDRLTGDLIIADVGQNVAEEVNYQPAGAAGGANYGWDVMEGRRCTGGACDPAAYTLPVIAYGHEVGACSVTGGYVYRGTQFPALQGHYFYADYCNGHIWAATPGTWTPTLVLPSGLNPSSFGEDVAGELYLLDHGGGGVYQIIP